MNCIQPTRYRPHAVPTRCWLPTRSRRGTVPGAGGLRGVIAWRLLRRHCGVSAEDVFVPGSNVGRFPNDTLLRYPSTFHLYFPFPFFLRCSSLPSELHRISLDGKFFSIPLDPLYLSLYASAPELLLLLSGQCPNPGPSYPCPVCGAPYSRRQHSYQCSRCGSWVHADCSGLARPADRRANPN